MSCHGETHYTANGDLKDWKVFRSRTIDLARAKDDPDFLVYVEGVSDKAWAHILEENFFTPQQAAERLWGFYTTDILPYTNKN